MDVPDQHIHKAMEMARELTVMADEGQAECRDDGCLLLCAVIRDCAYRIRAEATRERDRHRAQEAWR